MKYSRNFMILNAFGELGLDKFGRMKWITCKHMGTKFATMQEYEVAMKVLFASTGKKEK